MSLFFSRHTKLYLVQGANVWELPVLDGFSFSQAINSSEVTLAEMDSAAGSRRGKQVFNDSFAPAEWSFSTYARPLVSAGDGGAGVWEASTANHHSVEEALWANFVAANAWDGSSWTDGVTTNTSSVTYDFSGSNAAAVGEFSLIFTLGGCAPTGTPIYYEIVNSVVNSVSLDFEIDGITTLNWSGFGKSITETTEPTATIYEGITDSDNFIRNRLTTLDCVADTSVTGQAGFGSTLSGQEGVYVLPLTGGSISFENNISFLTPEELCKVNLPLRHVTGSRSVSGNFTCYLSPGDNSEGSADLFNDLAAANTLVTNDFDLTFNVGGAAAPKIAINLAHAHLEIPTHSIEDVIAVDVAFTGLPSDLDTPDEATIEYTGA